MEFSTEHIERQQQFNVLQKELAVRYTHLQRQYQQLQVEMIGYKTKAKLKKREQQLFGKKTEKSTHKQDQINPCETVSIAPKRWGQQPGSQGHGKREYSHLPAVEETISLLEEDAICPCCQLPYEELPGTEDSELLEIINVKGYRRVIRRKKYKRHCDCKENPAPKIMTPSAVERPLSKNKLGASIWALLLLK